MCKMRESDMDELTQSLGGLQLTNTGFVNFTPAMRRAMETKMQTSPVETGFTTHADAIANVLTSRLRESLAFMSPDSLIDWKETNFQTALVTLVANSYFQSEINSLFSSSSSASSVSGEVISQGNATATTTTTSNSTNSSGGATLNGHEITILVSDEDPIWTEASPDTSTYNPRQNYVRAWSRSGSYSYNDVTLYIYSKLSKELIIMQCELKYVNMELIFSNINDVKYPENPLNDPKKTSNAFKKKRVTSHEFMGYLKTQEQRYSPEDIPILSFQRVTDGTSGQSKNIPLPSKIGNIFVDHKKQCIDQLTSRAAMAQSEITKSSDVVKLKVVNYLIVGYANRVTFKKMGEITY